MVAVAHSPHRASRPASSFAQRAGPGSDVGAVRGRLRPRRVVDHRVLGSPRDQLGLWWLSPRVGWYVGAIRGSALHDGRRLRAASRRAGAWDRWILIVGLAQARLEQLGPRAAPGRGRCASVWCRVRICGGGSLSWRVAIIRLLRARPGRRRRFALNRQNTRIRSHVACVRISGTRLAIRRHDERAAEASPVVESTFARSLVGARLRSLEALSGGARGSAEPDRVHAAGDARPRASPPTGCGASAAALSPR